MSAELDLAGQDVQVKQSSNSPTIVPPSSNTLSERGTAKLLQVYRAAPAFQEQSTSTNEASQALFTKLYALQNTPLHTLAYKIRASGVNRQDLARYLAKLDKMSADSLPAELQQLQRDWREVKLQPAEDPLVWPAAQRRFNTLLRDNGEKELDWAQIDGCPQNGRTQAGLRDMEAHFERLRGRPELHDALVAVFQEYIASIEKQHSGPSSSRSKA